MFNSSKGSTNAGLAVIGGLIVVAVLVVAIASIKGSAAPAPTSENLAGVSGPQHQQIEQFKNGASLGGDYASFTVNGTIQAGSNQASWRNTTGRPVYIDFADVHANSGTASSSVAIYVSTSTSSTVSNYARPTGTHLLIDSALFATSTPYGSLVAVSTTTSNGYGEVLVPDLSYVNVSIQDRYACKSVGVCETATSTNRGIGTYDWYLKGHYKP